MLVALPLAAHEKANERQDDARDREDGADQVDDVAWQWEVNAKEEGRDERVFYLGNATLKSSSAMPSSMSLRDLFMTVSVLSLRDAL